MAKKRVVRKAPVRRNSTRRQVAKRVSSRKKIRRNNIRKPISLSKFDPREKLSNVGVSLRKLPTTERGILTLVLLFLGLVAAFSNGGIENITGNFVDITGNQVFQPDQGVSGAIIQAINVVFGVVDPVFKLLGSTDVIVFRIFLSVVLYLLLAFGLGLNTKMQGKGKIIAALIAIFVAAIVQEQLITKIVAPIHAVLLIAASFGIAFFALWWWHKYEPQSSSGHLLKAFLYFITLVFLGRAGSDLVRQLPPGIGNSFVSGTGIMSLISSGLIIYSIVMVGLELLRAAARRGESDREVTASDGLHSLIGTPEERRTRREERQSVEDNLESAARDALQSLEEVI